MNRASSDCSSLFLLENVIVIQGLGSRPVEVRDNHRQFHAMKVFALRLKPDSDLKESLRCFVASNCIQAGFILTTIGSLKKATIRFADQSVSKVLYEKFEIISLSGTLSLNGIHLHIAISDKGGKTFGGHLENGCTIYTTAEIVIGESEALSFYRELDQQTGFKELQVRERSSQDDAKNLGADDNSRLTQYSGTKL